MTAFTVLPAVRLVKGATGAISHQFTDHTGEPAAPPTGTLAVTVTRSDGSTVSAGSITGDGTEPRAVSIPVSEMLVTDWLTAVWTLDEAPTATDVVEVVGGTLGNVAELRATDPTLNGAAPAELLDKRQAVEDMSLAVLHRAVFERFCVERVEAAPNGAALFVTFPDVLEVAWARVWSGTTSTDLTADQLADLKVDGRVIESRSCAWTGCTEVEVGYRFGMRSCPKDLLMALRKSIRHALNSFDAGVPAFAASMQTADGFSIGIAGPGNEDWATGDRDIDRVVNRYKYAPPVMA